MLQVLTGKQKPAQALRSELTSQPGRQTISKQMGDSSEHRPWLLQGPSRFTSPNLIAR